jgi:hypothetical protein
LAYACGCCGSAYCAEAAAAEAAAVLCKSGIRIADYARTKDNAQNQASYPI